MQRGIWYEKKNVASYSLPDAGSCCLCSGTGHRKLHTYREYGTLLSYNCSYPANYGNNGHVAFRTADGAFRTADGAQT